MAIKGDIEAVERSKGRTEVMVDEGANSVVYTLDDGLIEFGTAVDDGNLQRAMDYLESLPLTPESETMWRTLGRLAVEQCELAIAVRAYAATGNMSKARFLQDVCALAREHGPSHYSLLRLHHSTDCSFHATTHRKPRQVCALVWPSSTSTTSRQRPSISPR